MRRRNLVFILLVMILIVGFMPVTAFAEENAGELLSEENEAEAQIVSEVNEAEDQIVSEEIENENEVEEEAKETEGVLEASATYNIWVGSTQVTDANKDAILSPEPKAERQAMIRRPTP